MLKRILLAVSTFVAGGCVVWAGNYVFNQPEFYGPFVCEVCQLRRPAADVATKAYIDYMDNWLADGGNYKPLESDKFMVCNSEYCVVYTRTASGDFMGGAATPMTFPGGGSGGDGGGGGGAAGGGGGIDQGHGNWGNEPPMCDGPCSGTVTVGGR